MGVENYLEAIEVDPNNRLTPRATGVDIVGLTRNEDAHLYWDKTVGHFSGDYEHLFECQIDSGADSGGGAAPWGLSNDIDDLNGLVANSKDAHFAWIFNNVGTYTIDLYEFIGGTVYSDRFTGAADTHYYCKSRRDETGGTLQLFIYSDSARTILLDTLVVSLHENEDFRYVWAVNSGNISAIAAMDDFSQNLDLQEAVEAVAQRFAGIFGVGRMGGIR